MKPGLERQISPEEIQMFRKEHGNPPYFEWRFTNDLKIKKGINKLLISMVDNQKLRKQQHEATLKPLKSSKCQNFFTMLLQGIGID